MSIVNQQKKVRAKKAKPVDKATPVIRKPKATDAEKISVTRQITSAMKAAPQWNASPDLQAANNAWNTAANNLESNAASVKETRSKLAQLEASQAAYRQDWQVATRKMTATVAVVAERSPDTVRALGYDVVTHVTPGLQPAPSGIVALPATVSGEAAISWQKGTARKGFMVQRAGDPANPASFVAPVPCTKTKFKIDGEKSASVVSFRVAAIDPKSPTGVSPWSDWVAATVG
jgi:hypothetical protein